MEQAERLFYLSAELLINIAKSYGGLPLDFLSSSVALVNLMRLSLLKAAHVVVGECCVQEIRVARLSRPRYAPTARRGRLANLGHRSCPCWSCYDTDSVGTAESYTK